MKTADDSYEWSEAENDAIDEALAAMTSEQLEALQEDADARHAVFLEARINAIGAMDADEAAIATSRLLEEMDGPLFTDRESDLVFDRDHTPADRARMEIHLRQDPVALAKMKRLAADAVKTSDSALSPMAKQWLIRIGVGLIVGLILLANRS